LKKECLLSLKQVVKPVITLEDSLTLESVLLTLAHSNVKCAPVLSEGVVIGLLDVVDMVRFVVQEYKEARKSSIPFFTKLRELRSSKWNQCILDASARQLIEARPNIGKQWVALDSRESIHSVMSVFALGVHRVVVTGDDEQVIAILSQRDIIRYFLKHPHFLRSVAKKTLQSLNCYKKRNSLICVSPNMKTVEAFALMLQYDISAVAVVEKDTFRLIGNLSSNHVKGITVEGLTNLQLSVEKFLSAVEPDKSKWATRAKSSCSVDDLVHLFHRSGAHRVWIVDDQNVLEGLITLTDLNQLIISNTFGMSVAVQ